MHLATELAPPWLHVATITPRDRAQGDPMAAGPSSGWGRAAACTMLAANIAHRAAARTGSGSPAVPFEALFHARVVRGLTPGLVLGRIDRAWAAAAGEELDRRCAGLAALRARSVGYASPTWRFGGSSRRSGGRPRSGAVGRRHRSDVARGGDNW